MNSTGKKNQSLTNAKALDEMEKIMTLKGFAPSTQKAYLAAVKKLSEFLKLPLSKVDYDHVRKFLLNAINERKLSSEYINTAYSGIKFLYESVYERDWNMKSVPRIKKKRKFPQTLTYKEVERIIKATSNLKHKAILATIYSGGLRVSEAANLRIIDIDSQNMRIFINQGKGGKDRFTCLSQKSLEILREYFKKHKPKIWLFQSDASTNENPKPVHTRTIQAVFQDSKIKAGITKTVTPHSLRHSFATHLVERGVNLIKVKELLGHDTIETTMVYIHLANKDIVSVKSPLDTDWED